MLKQSNRRCKAMSRGVEPCEQSSKLNPIMAGKCCRSGVQNNIVRVGGGGGEAIAGSEIEFQHRRSNQFGSHCQHDPESCERGLFFIMLSKTR